MDIRTEHIKEELGEIVHVERSALHRDELAVRCLELLEERGVLVFPRLGLSDEVQLAFTDRLGTRGRRAPDPPDRTRQTPADSPQARRRLAAAPRSGTVIAH